MGDGVTGSHYRTTYADGDAERMSTIMGARMSKRVVKTSKFNRISLNLTVPRKISKSAWKHLLASVEQFEESNKVAVVDLDMRSLPLGSLR
jgi:hypothetical protein